MSVDISSGDNLGLMIRGGAEFGIGIFITGVDHNSVAETIGLRVSKRKVLSDVGFNTRGWTDR